MNQRAMIRSAPAEQKSARQEWIAYITALSTEEMPSMPLPTTSNNDLTLDRRLATPAPGTEQFMEIQMAVKPQ